MLLHEFLTRSADKNPHQIAIIYQNIRLDYSKLDQLSNLLSIRFLKNGIFPGDRVVVLLDNSDKYIISYFGILKAGGVVVPMNTHLVNREIAVIINDCTPRFVVTDLKHAHLLKDIIHPKNIFFIDKLKLSANTKFQSRSPIINQDALAMIIYTSGTTGKPKGVMLTHRNLTANAESIVEYLHLDCRDRIMVVIPFYYSYGNSLLTTHISVGATFLIDNRFYFPNHILELMEKKAVTGFAGVPSHFIILLKASSLRKKKLKALRYVTLAGGAMPSSMIRDFTEILPHVKFYVMYGQTEASARLTYLDPCVLKNKYGSIGKAIPHVEVKVVDEHGKQIRPGDIGEIVARGENVMSGYWNAPEETEKVLKEKTLWTGDLAKIDEEEYIYLVGRKKEMIKVGANRVSPLEIEEVVSCMPNILECAAVGVPDEILGEIIKICVVKNGNMISEDDIMMFCVNNLASYKVPKIIEFREKLPKTASGKIMRWKLLTGMPIKSFTR